MRRYITLDGRPRTQADTSELLQMLALAEKELDQLMDANTRMSFEYNKLKRENDALRKDLDKAKAKLKGYEADPSIDVEVKTI